MPGPQGPKGDPGTPADYAGNNTWTGSNLFAIGSATAIPVTVRAALNQSADLTQWQNNAGAPISRISAAGEFESLVAGAGVYLKSPNGTRYRVTVSDTGALTVAAA